MLKLWIFMSFVFQLNCNHKIRGSYVVCDLFRKRCARPLSLWLRNTWSRLHLFWKHKVMRQDTLLRFYVWHWIKCRLFCAELLCHAAVSGRNRNPACVFLFFFVQEVPDHRCCDGQCELAVWLLLKAISCAATLRGEEALQRAHTPGIIQGSIWDCWTPRFNAGQRRLTVTDWNYKMRIISVNYSRILSLNYSFIHNCP